MSRQFGACRRILVTGGAGYLGSHLADRQLDAGHDALWADNLSPASMTIWRMGRTILLYDRLVAVRLAQTRANRSLKCLITSSWTPMGEDILGVCSIVPGQVGKQPVYDIRIKAGAHQSI